MGRLTSNEKMQLKSLEKDMALLSARLRGVHDPEQDRYIKLEISMKEREISLIKARPAIREREAEFERAQKIRWMALCKLDGIDLGSFEEEWRRILPEAAEKGWLKRYGSQVDMWIIELRQKGKKKTSPGKGKVD